MKPKSIIKSTIKLTTTIWLTGGFLFLLLSLYLVLIFFRNDLAIAKLAAGLFIVPFGIFGIKLLFEGLILLLPGKLSIKNQLLNHPKNFLWIYQLNRSREINKPRVEKKFRIIVLANSKGKKTALVIKNKNWHPLSEHLSAQNPKLILGYNKKLNDLYEKDPQNFS